MIAKFPLGRIVATPGALAALERATQSAALFLALAACSAPSEQTPDTDLRTKLRLTRPDWAQSMKPTVNPARALGPEDFVGPDGRCAGDPAPAEGPSPRALYFQAGPETNPAPPPPAPGSAPPGSSQPGRGVALEMSECDLVRAVGYTGQVEISEAIRIGMDARREGNEEVATAKLHRAHQLALEAGDLSTAESLAKVIEIAAQIRKTSEVPLL